MCTWGTVVKLAFRTLIENDHPLNEIAACMTRKCGENKPGGRMCHVEVLMEVDQGQWFKTSINYKEYDYTDEKTGKVVYKDGVVHFQKIEEQEMSQYLCLDLPIDRSKQKTMYEFARAQFESGFNFKGYAFNTFPFIFKFGTRSFHADMLDSSNKCTWFCSEYVVVLLQAAGVFEHEVARIQSPNSIFRLAEQIGARRSGQPMTVQKMRL